MALEICLLASGSKGNSIYIKDKTTSLLIDAGICSRELNKRAQQAGIDLSGISGILSTHCHTDHCKGMKVFLKNHDVPVYVHNQGKSALLAQTGLAGTNLSCFSAGFSVGSISVTPISVPHDVPHCSGFMLSSGGSSVGVVMDLGEAGENVLSALYGADAVIIESNHDIDMLKKGSYPEALKRRILSGRGHLSNLDAGNACKKLLDRGTRSFILSHLSEENNLPELAFESLCGHLGKHGLQEGRDYFANVAFQHKPTQIFKTGSIFGNGVNDDIFKKTL